MENPGSFHKALENNPELTEMQVRKLWESDVLHWIAHCKTQEEVVIEPVPNE